MIRQILLNTGNDGNDYIERPARAERPRSTYVTAYDTVNPLDNTTQYENKPGVSSSNGNEAGPRSSSYENNIGLSISSYGNQQSTSSTYKNQASTSSTYENQASTSSTYENQASTSSTYENQASTSSYENQSSVQIKDDLKYENQKEFCKNGEAPLSASAIENDDNSIYTPYQDIALRSHQVSITYKQAMICLNIYVLTYQEINEEKMI